MKKVTVLVILLSLLFFTIALAEEGKDYTVKKGDTLSGICLKLMENGTPEVWHREAKRLGLKNSNLIIPGQILHFPYVYRLKWHTETGYSGHSEWSLDENSVKTNFKSLSKDDKVIKSINDGWIHVHSWYTLEQK